MTVIPIEEMHWTTDGENLSVYKNNDEITDDTTHIWAGNHLLLYYVKMECVFFVGGILCSSQSRAAAALHNR
jgi:hypothetical protein